MVEAAFFDDWEPPAQACVANIRPARGYDPHDGGATLEPVEELGVSPRFRALRVKNDARGKTHEAKAFVHPDVGRLTLEFNAFDVRGAAGQQLIVYGAEPASPSDHALRLLATIAATRDAAVHAASPALCR